jgi:hypothetical protein
LIIAAAIAEAILKAAVLIDIRRRPASKIRGSKRMWIVANVDRSGGTRQLRRGRAAVILRLRAASAALIRLAALEAEGQVVSLTATVTATTSATNGQRQS